MKPIKIGIVGVGKIVRDQHLPALAANADYQLVCAASRNATVDGVSNFTTIDNMLAEVRDLDAVSLCMPPQNRYDAARKALLAGKHVFLEKPPGATVSEVADLLKLAGQNNVSLFASWHSRYAPAVEAARAFLQTVQIRSARIIWKEDVRRWHPNQDWIWQAGGLGVFDPGINALSIATHILPPMFVSSAILHFPSNKDAPVAAMIEFRNAIGAPVTMELDWLQTGPQSWDIIAETDNGRMVLSSGGAALSINGSTVQQHAEREYPALYEKFAKLVREKASDVDLSPLQHVADAFMLGRRVAVAPFYD
ncbi:MAG: Gfo/Idh/MocA family oxidoreductase [Rhizobiaceae bacterium]|nr:Gfo/Idh/MocA family oxidoreductase [Rhizobiaceae bacterium]